MIRRKIIQRLKIALSIDIHVICALKYSYIICLKSANRKLRKYYSSISQTDGY